MNYINRAQQYFPFGQEGKQLKHYVREQLLGEETRKNQNILRQFQKQAEARRHHYLHQHRFSTNIHQEKVEPKRYRTLQIPTAEEQAKNNPKLRYPLIPADRQKPPIYKYHDSGSVSLNVSPEHYSKSRFYQQSVKQKKNSLNVSRRNIDPSHRSWALQKIKEQALLRRERKPNKVDRFEPDLSDSDVLLRQLQKEEQRSRQQFQEISWKVRRLKKYRHYIKQHQKTSI